MGFVQGTVFRSRCICLIQTFDMSVVVIYVARSDEVVSVTEIIREHTSLT